MNSNLQSRSASVSQTPSDTRERSYRSASLGAASLFSQKDSLNFFSKDDTSNSSPNDTVELDESLEAAQEPLDIVGALSTLNLDAELNEPRSEPYSEVTNESVSTSDKVSPDVSLSSREEASAPVPPQHMLHNPTSFTPNPPSAGAFGAFGGSTPSNTWGTTFVPLSAPPFAYPMSDPTTASDLAMRITPFQLPETNAQGSAFKDDMSGLLTISPQPMHHFGGALDSHFTMESLHASSEQYGVQSFGPRNRKSSDSELLTPKFDAKLFTPNGAVQGSERSTSREYSSTSPQPFGGVSLWNQSYTSMNSFVPQQAGNSFINDSADQMRHMTSGRNEYRTSSSNGSKHNHYDADGSSGGYPQYGGHRRHHYNQNNMNSGVNVHRKMHNSNRRKGDDAAKYASARLEDFIGEIYSLCKDQHGCRFLQRQLDAGQSASVKAGGSEKDSSREIAATVIFNEIYLKIVELMVDPFGNYLIQKLFENVSADQRLILVKNAAPEFVRIALDPHGTRALQKLIECISTPEESRFIIESLMPHIVPLSRDLNGNHVVQRCLQRLSPEENQFVFDAASTYCIEIATHRHGCCVLQRCLDYGNSKQREQLSMRVAEMATTLSLDPFGNYVVQYVMSRGDERSIPLILDHILANIVTLSLHKFGLNVIEKSLRISKLTDSVISVLLNNTKQFSIMLNDPFGNYVLQTSLDVASKDDLSRLANALRPYLPNIKNTPHGRRIMTKIQSIL